MSRWKLGAALILAALITTALSAQEFRGSVLGRLTDPSGAVLANALVIALNEENGTRSGTRTNTEGNYNLPFLLPGVYRIEVEATGFRKYVRPGVVVQVNDKITVDVSMQLGQVSEIMTVTADAPILQTANADMGQVVDRRLIDRLPMSSMNVMNLVDMAPGVLGGGGGQISNEQNDIAINGGSGNVRGNEITVDGIPNVNPRFNGLAVTVPSADAVEEFKVLTTMFDASNGRSNGGAVSFSTKSGTNQYHGTAYGFWYDEILNANGWARNRSGQQRAPLNQHRYGFTAGGPVKLPSRIFGPLAYDGSNKTFFFVAYETYESQNDFLRFARVPTGKERAGDFSQTLSLAGGPLGVYDPYTTVGTVRQPFPGAVIPASRHDRTGRTVMGLYALPNQNVTPRVALFNWTGSGIYKGTLDNLSARFDQVIGRRQRLYLRFSQLDAMDAREPTAMRGAYDLPSSASSRSSENQNPRHNKSVAFDDSIVLSPTLFASLRYGYTRTHLYEYFEANGFDPAEMALPDLIVRNQVSRGWAIFKPAENMPYLGSKVRTSINDTHAFYVTLNQLKSRHTLKYGLDTRVVRWNENNPGETQNGRFNFDSVFTRSDSGRSSTSDTSGTAMASMLLGVPASGDFGYTSALSLQAIYTSFFVQDDIRLTPRLTLNLGLRWELETPVTERWDRISYGFDETAVLPVKVPAMTLAGGLLFVDQAGRGRRGGVLDWNNFGPRFGFAYSHNTRTIVRGGYGFFYSSALMNLGGRDSVNTTSLGAQPSFNAITRYRASVDGNRTPYTTLANPYPEGLTVPTGSSLGVMTEIGNSISFTSPYRVLPYVQQWQLSFQRELGWKTVVEAAYAGSHALKLFNNYNWNERSDRFLVEGTNEFQTLTNPFLGIFPATSTLGGGATITRSRLWVRFPQFNQVNVYALNSDRALYHSAQLRVQKRFSNGVSFVVNYTYSKSMYYDGASLVNDRQFRTVATINRPHIFRTFATWEMPFGRRRAFGHDWPKWLDLAAGGWELGGSVRWTSGQPLSVAERRGRPTPLANPALATAVHDRLGDRVDPKTGAPLNPFFDTTVWRRLPDDYSVSTEPPRLGWLRGPATFYLSNTLFKTVRVSEKIRCEVRAEVNNPTNTPQFGNPATDMSNPATFGIITSAGGTRNMNVSLRVRW